MNRRSNRNWKGYILAPSLPLSPKVKGDDRPGSGAWAVESRTPWPRCRTTGFPCSLEQGADHEHVGTFRIHAGEHHFGFKGVPVRACRIGIAGAVVTALSGAGHRTTLVGIDHPGPDRPILRADVPSGFGRHIKRAKKV